jgi:SAM-dependent methyltransferase
MLVQAAARFPDRRVNADAVALPFRARAFDAAAFVWSLHHISEPGAALREAARVVGPGGRIVAVAGPSMQGPDDEIRHAHARLDAALRPTRIEVARDAGSVGVAAGLALVMEDQVRVTYDTTPNQAADAIEGGLYSTTWGIDASTFDRVVRPVLDELRALPEPDRTRERHGIHPVVVFEAG